jgi:two-component system response regulator CpxR
VTDPTVRGFTVLFISEDVHLSRQLENALEPHQVALMFQTDVAEAVSDRMRDRYGLVMLDAAADGVALPGLVRDVLRHGPVPLIVITPDRDPVSAARILDSGADDCIGRPVCCDDVVARVRAVLRRSHALPPPLPSPLDVGDLRIDGATRSVFVDAHAVNCTSIEFDILEELARAAGRVVSRDRLSAAVCGRAASPFDRAIDVHVSHLRRKLRPHRLRIVTVRGIGYMLAAPLALRRPLLG